MGWALPRMGAAALELGGCGGQPPAPPGYSWRASQERFRQQNRCKNAREARGLTPRSGRLGPDCNAVQDRLACYGLDLGIIGPVMALRGFRDSVFHPAVT